MSIKKKKLNDRLSEFVKQIEKDLVFKKDILSVHDPNAVDTALTLFEHDAWLFCETASERRSRQHFRRELQKKPDLTIASKRLDDKAFPLFENWLKQTLPKIKSVQEEHFYPFYPKEKKTSVGILLKNLKNTIEQCPNRSLIVEAARMCRRDTISHLFTDIDKRLLSKQVINQFLKEHGLALATEEAIPIDRGNQKPIINNPGRRSIPSGKVVRYIKHLVNRYLLDPVEFRTIGITVLVIWCILAVARYGRRSTSISNILTLKENDIRVKTVQGSSLCTYQLLIDKISVPISQSLHEMLMSILDRRKTNGKIFTIDRSTIENHLKAASQQLGYDLQLFPLSPETFLERPLECGLDDQ